MLLHPSAPSELPVCPELSYLRNIKQQFYLNAEEKKLLKEKSKRAGLNESEFMRSMIKGYKLKEQPTKEIVKFTRDISGIANNINQIARIVNTRGYARDDELEYIKTTIPKFILEFQKKINSRN